MAQFQLSATTREVKGKQVSQLRREGLVPAVLYGRLTQNASLALPKREFDLVLRQAGMTQLVGLIIDGQGEARNILVRDVQRNILTGEPIHADLYEVVMTDVITTEIPIVLIGVSPAASHDAGVLIQGLNSVQVECLPGDLIPEIKVDISGLAEVHQSITVADLVLPAGIKVLAASDEMVVTISPMRAEEAEAVVEEAPAAVEPERVTKPKAEEEPETKAKS